MPESSDPSPESIAAFVREVEGALGVPEGLLASLHELDDWSCVIKAHALVEGALTHLLVGVLGRPELQNAFSRLELSTEHTGKVAIAKALGVISEHERRFIRALSELRNRLVHEIKNASFSFPTYLASLDSNQKNQFVKSFGLAVFMSPDGAAVAHSSESLTHASAAVLRYPKVFVATGASVISYKAYVERLSAEQRRRVAATSPALLQFLDELGSGA